MICYKLIFKRIASTNAGSPVYEEIGSAYVEMAKIPDADALMDMLKEQFNIEESDIDHFWHKRKLEEPDLRSFIKTCYFGVQAGMRKINSPIAVVLNPGVEYSKPNANANAGPSRVSEVRVSEVQTDGNVSEANVGSDDDKGKPWYTVDPENPPFDHNLLLYSEVERHNEDEFIEDSDTW